MAGQDPALRNIILGTAAVNLGIPLGAQAGEAEATRQRSDSDIRQATTTTRRTTQGSC